MKVVLTLEQKSRQVELNIKGIMSLIKKTYYSHKRYLGLSKKCHIVLIKGVLPTCASQNFKISCTICLLID